jgi:hypothetical protein
MTLEQGYKEKIRQICLPFPPHKVMMSCNNSRCGCQRPRRADRMDKSTEIRPKNALFGPDMRLCGLCHAVVRIFCVTWRTSRAKVMPKSCQSHAEITFRYALALFFDPDQEQLAVPECLYSVPTGDLLILYHTVTEMVTRRMRSTYQPHHTEVS